MSHTYLRFPPAPNLPLAPQEWEYRYQDQFANILRLYFNQLSTGLQQLTNTRGGYRLSFPHGAFYDTTTQTVASTTTAYTITLNSTSESSGVSVTSGSRITVEEAGIYNLQFSIQLNNLDTAPQDVDVWIRHNGVDIPNSNSRFGLAARKNIADPFHVVGALNFMHEMTTGDYMQIMWRASSTNVSIVAYTAGTAPTRPAIPSVIATMSFVSAPLG
jgi:hypothetical protein